MSDVFRNGAFVEDPWVRIDDEAPIPDDGFVLVPLARWLAERDNLIARNHPLGIVVSVGEKIENVAGDLDRFQVVAVDFPAYTDGRGYSTARLARDRYGYTGELRAVGNVLADQVPLMARCGFDTFAVTKPAARAVLEDGGVPDVPVYYQPVTRPESPVTTIRPWMRRSPPGLA
ncbi:DUF934 domain-containing protein [Amorphus coralli]|uniref:DUF934 domain-containing protein n=1 Tax=Amorphus coralli TaxID=340680 RepID=UPI0003771969|nr:DUF934 domain-containing protein [Amorphus coralli]